jgi:hypothetical protein
MRNRDLNKKPGVKTGTRDALAVDVSYKTPTMLLLFKFGKSNVGDRRNTGVTHTRRRTKTNITQKQNTEN